MNIRDHAKALYDNWFTTGQPRCIFEGVIWPICAKGEADASIWEDRYQMAMRELTDERLARKRAEAELEKVWGGTKIENATAYHNRAADAGPAPNEAPNEEAVRAALALSRFYNDGEDPPTTEQWHMLRSPVDTESGEALRILAAEVRRLRGSEPQNGHSA